MRRHFLAFSFIAVLIPVFLPTTVATEQAWLCFCFTLYGDTAVFAYRADRLLICGDVVSMAERFDRANREADSISNIGIRHIAFSHRYNLLFLSGVHSDSSVPRGYLTHHWSRGCRLGKNDANFLQKK